ncbi:MAG: hypothetical protein KDN22_28115 [Verrucomicrobiae bacterium]|nr:hypothetical protein [Verrucomicrobiae bacterium]
MNPLVTYSEIDEILKPWADERKLHIATKYKDEEVRVISVLDEHRDEYHLFVCPEPKVKEKKVIVGCGLVNRHSKKHTFSSKMKNFRLREAVELQNLRLALDTCLAQIEKWGDEQVGGDNVRS